MTLKNLKLRELRVKSKTCAASRKIAKKELDAYLKNKREQERRPWARVIEAYRGMGREEARYYHVAYSLLRGNNYRDIERSCNNKLNPKKLYEIISKYDYSYSLEKVEQLIGEQES